MTYRFTSLMLTAEVRSAARGRRSEEPKALKLLFCDYSLDNHKINSFNADLQTRWFESWQEEPYKNRKN